MQVTVVSHAGIANRIKNILSAMSQYDVSTQHETINYIFPSIPLVEEPSRTYPEDWRLRVAPEEENIVMNIRLLIYYLKKHQTIL